MLPYIPVLETTTRLKSGSRVTMWHRGQEKVLLVILVYLTERLVTMVLVPPIVKRLT